jgi:hypothetical protein
MSRMQGSLLCSETGRIPLNPHCTLCRASTMTWPDASLHDRFNGTSADQLFFSLLWLSIVRSLSHSGCHASLYSQGKPSHLENMNVSKLLPELHSLSLPVQVVSLITRTSHHMEQSELSFTSWISDGASFVHCTCTSLTLNLGLSCSQREKPSQLQSTL